MYVYVCIYIYIYIYTYTCIYIYIYRERERYREIWLYSKRNQIHPDVTTRKPESIRRRVNMVGVNMVLAEYHQI